MDENNAALETIQSSYHSYNIERWLSPPDPSVNANHARRLRHDGTGSWLLQDGTFQEWKLGSRRNLWLSGLAGSGKTVLSATVLDHLEVDARDHLILSFFFDFNDSKKQTLDGMLRSLVFQLYHQSAGSLLHVNRLFLEHKEGGAQPSRDVLSNITDQILASFTSVYIVVDALDECTTRRELLSWIRHILRVPQLDHVKIICTDGQRRNLFLNCPSSLVKKTA